MPTTSTQSESSRPCGRTYWLLTGGTGLVGQYLIRDLTLAGQRLAVIVRPGRKLTPHQRIENLMQHWERELDRSLPRPVVLTGDVAQPRLGLEDTDRRWVREHCSRLIHNAAVLEFHTNRDGEPWKTNAGGTRNVLELADEIEPNELHYVSTAYVCGCRDGLIREDELDCGQTFRNDYEQSKFQAEQSVRQARGDWTTTIYRPAVIAGDSETGYTSTYHGLYLYLRLLATLVPQQKRNEHGVIETPIRLPMQGDEPRNLVPVQWVSQVMTRILLDPRAHGQTYHLVPNAFVTPRLVIEACYEYFNSDGVQFCGPTNERPADNEFSARYFENARMYEDYETSDPRFDNTNLLRVAGDLPCPVIDKQTILRYMEFGVADRWGKRRPRPPQIEFDAAAHLNAIGEALRQFEREFERAGNSAIPPDNPIGIRWRGPGGGDWKMIRVDDQWLPQPGLPRDENENVFLESDVTEIQRDCPTTDSAAKILYWLDQLQTQLASRRT